MNRTQSHTKNMTLAGERIGFFGKGGSGKSTIIVLLAQELRDQGYEVCILDADSTNIGLPYVLGIDTLPTPLIEYFGGMIFSGGLVTCPVDDPDLLPGRHLDLEELDPRYYRQSPSGITLLTAGKIGEQGPGAGCDGPISKIARDLRIYQDGRPLLTLVDFKAGFEDIARGAITSLDWSVVIIDPTIAAIRMAENLRDTIDQINHGVLPATHHLEDPLLVDIANRLYSQASIKGAIFVLNKISDKSVENYLYEELARRGIRPAGVIHDIPEVTRSWLRGMPLNNDQAREDTHKIAAALEAAERSYPLRV